MTENNGIFAWQIKDKEGNNHQIKYVKNSYKDRKVYFDGELIHTVPNDLKHYEFFNHEITFEVLEMKCKLECLLTQNLFKKEPKLLINGVNARSRVTEKEKVIPKMPVYGFVFMILSTLLAITSVVCARLFAKDYIAYIYAFATLVPLWVTTNAANMPLPASLSKFKAGSIRLLFLICLLIVTLSLITLIVL